MWLALRVSGVASQNWKSQVASDYSRRSVSGFFRATDTCMGHALVSVVPCVNKWMFCGRVPVVIRVWFQTRLWLCRRWDLVRGRVRTESYLGCPSPVLLLGLCKDSSPHSFKVTWVLSLGPRASPSFSLGCHQSSLVATTEETGSFKVCLRRVLSEGASADFGCLHRGCPRLSVSAGEGWVLQEMLLRAFLCGWRRRNSETVASDLTTCPFIREAFYLSYTQTHTHIPTSATWMSGWQRLH